MVESSKHELQLPEKARSHISNVSKETRTRQCHRGAFHRFPLSLSLGASTIGGHSVTAGQRSWVPTWAPQPIHPRASTLSVGDSGERVSTPISTNYRRHHHHHPHRRRRRLRRRERSAFPEVATSLRSLIVVFAMFGRWPSLSRVMFSGAV